MWNTVGLLQNVQYPWRLLSLTLPVSAFCASFWVSRLKKKWVGLLLALFAVGVTVSYFRPTTYEPRNEKYYLSRPNFTDGTSSMGNTFTTIWTSWKHEKADAPVVVTGGVLKKVKSDTYTDKIFEIAMESPGEVRVNTLYFPGWKAFVDSKPLPISYRNDGIIHVQLPKGMHSVHVVFGSTPVRTMAIVCSVISLVAVLAWGILHV